MLKKSEVDIVTEEHVRNGGVLAKLYFDMQHKEKDKLKPLMVDLINNRLLKEKGVVYCYGAIEEPIENHGAYITNSRVTILTENFTALVNIVFNYAPAGIEIVKPEKTVEFKISELQGLLLDISQISVGYSKYILERVLTPEEKKDIERSIENRAELGKKLLEKKD
ncbi:MAG: hypothetical protein QXN59_00295 [Candidatus Micrarchaeaceae archaeon]